MRKPTLMLTAAAAALLAAAAMAQDLQPPAEAPAKQEPGLSDLSTTVEGLEDQPAPSETPPAGTPPGAA